MSIQLFSNSRRIKLRWPLFVLTALLVAGCRPGPEADEPAAPQEVPRNVRVLMVAPGDLTEYLEVSGPVGPVRGADLSAQESGPVVRLAVAKGQAVSKGQVLVELDREILGREKEASAANLKAQRYNVEQVRRLYAAEKVSRLDLLNSESAFEQALSAAQVSQERYERAAITAPFDGVLVQRYVELGQLVMPGQAVARVIDTSRLKLETYLTDREVRMVPVGTRAQVELAGDQSAVTATATATVTWVAVEADRRTGKFKLEMEIPNADGQLRSGVIGRARMPRKVLSGVLSIPRDAVLFSGDETSVFVVRADRARRQPVVLGSGQGSLVTVKRGLQAGDRLVVRGHRALRDSSLVAITETTTRRDGLLDSDPAVLRNPAPGTGEENR